MEGYFCTDDTDCGLCSVIEGDDIPECQGLYRVECNLDPEIYIPSRNVWMVPEVIQGCRVG